MAWKIYVSQLVYYTGMINKLLSINILYKYIGMITNLLSYLYIYVCVIPIIAFDIAGR